MRTKNLKRLFQIKKNQCCADSFFQNMWPVRDDPRAMKDETYKLKNDHNA